MKMIIGFISALLFPVFALAQEPIPEIDLNIFFGKLVEAVTSGQWVIVGAGVVLILVWAFRKYLLSKLNVGSVLLPYLSLGLGALFGLASYVFGGMPIDEALKIVFLSGPLASSLWAAIIKLFLKKE